MEKAFYSTRAIGEFLGITGRQVIKLAHQGRIPHVRRGRLILIPCQAWVDYLAAQNAAAMATLQNGATHAAD